MGLGSRGLGGSWDCTHDRAARSGESSGARGGVRRSGVRWTKLLLSGADRRNVGEVVTAKIGDRELAEDIVEDRGCVLDRVVALNEARRLEAREGERVDVFLERHAILQADRYRDREISSGSGTLRPPSCMSMKISPSRPSAYSPVLRWILWPRTRAFWVWPFRRAGRDSRTTRRAKRARQVRRRERRPSREAVRSLPLSPPS